MSNKQASRQTQANKRLRFEPEPIIPSPSTLSTPPVKLAMDSVCTISETLQPSLAPVVREIGEKHITLFKLYIVRTYLTKI